MMVDDTHVCVALITGALRKIAECSVKENGVIEINVSGK
jgi:hypothetical protein